MTRRRQPPTPAPTAVLFKRWLALAGVALLASGCAALPEDAPVMEQLDEETGLTITRLGRPVELFRETFQRDPAGRFAFIGPFETNSMGRRDLYLWLAVPVELAAGSEPEVRLDGQRLVLGTPGRGPDLAGLGKSPYRIPTPWSAMFYYKIDGDVVGKLAAASSLSVRVTEQVKDGTTITVFASSEANPALKEFAQR